MKSERLIQAAYAYLYIGAFEEAMAAFVRAMEADPERPEPYFHASITAHRNARFEEAMEWAKTALELASDEPLYQAHYDSVRASIEVEQGKAAYIRGDSAEALRRLKAAIALDPLHEAANQTLRELERIDAHVDDVQDQIHPHREQQME